MRKNASCKRRRVHEARLVALAVALHEEGLGSKRIAQKLELPVTTVRNWLQGKTRGRWGA